MSCIDLKLFMLSEFIAQVVVLTNVARANEGLQPLTLNSQLSATAQGHSEDMAENDFFSPLKAFLSSRA